MAKYKCKMCGAHLDVSEGQTVVTCDFCQSKQTVANANDERKENLFNRANSLRASCDFDKAILSYQSILSIFPNEPEAHWGLCLCKYGIEYVDDPSTKKKIPTIHRVSFDSILKDSDYLAALSYADAVAREEYQDEAKQIADIQKNILSISQKEEPFDIFICYKETGTNGKRTPDSVWAQEIYSNLTDKGYKVFFSRITLENKLGSMYEPYIFAALNSAKIMIVVGGKKEHFEAVWVKNEWSRFIDMMKTRPDHYLIPCYRDMDAYEMPEQFLAFQGQDMSKLGFMQDLLRGIDKIMGRNDAPKGQTETKIIQTDVNVSALLKRSEILIGDGNFDKADELLERVLDNDPTNSQAYLLKLLIELQFNSVEQLKTLRDTIESNSNFRKAYDFGDSQQKSKLSSINEYIINRNEEERLQTLYNKAIDLKNEKRYAEAEAAFSQISGYRDASKQALDCVNLGKEDIYKKALDLKERGLFNEAIETFDKVKDYKDSEYQASECQGLFIKKQYEDAIALKENGKYDEAIAIFMEILSYQDADFQVDECERLKTEARKEAVYVTCVFNREINPYFDADALKKACERLTTIPGYKDADSLLVRYEGILADYKAELEKKRQEAARAKTKKMKKVKKVSLFTALGAVVLTGVLLLTFLLFIPSGRQSDIQTLINAGKYDEATALIEKNGDFGDTKNLIAMCNAGRAFQSLDYETGIDYIYNIGGTVDVSYDNNGGNSEKGNEQIKRVRGYINNDADKYGYEFHGWVLTGYNIDAKNHYASINLKAQYEIITYTISYDLGGGTANSLPNTYNTEESVSIPNPTKEGYTFLGWTGLDLSTATIDYVLPQGSTGNKTYTATWKANDYKIYLNANGGTVSKTEIDVKFDSAFVLPEPTFNGYDFKGWFDVNSTKFVSGTYKTASNLYLNASWDAHDYSITYNLGGGTNDSRNPATYTIEDSDITLKDPSRKGYTFTGWTTNAISTPTKDLKIIKGSTGNLEFTANWSANEYTVRVDLNGGECDITSYTFIFDSAYSITKPTRVGYVFDKFTYNDSDVLSTSGTWSIANDIEIKAHWIANANTKYIVNHYTEDLDGEGYTKVDTDNLAGYSDSSITVNANTYEGFTAQKTSQKITIAADGTTVVDFYYTRNSYAISFVTNGGSSIYSKTYKYEEQIPSTLKAIRDGYTFAGWYTDEKQTTLFDKMPANDQTVYAYYSEETKASFFTYTFSGQEVTIIKGKGLSGPVVVPEYIAGKLVTAIGNNAFENCSAVTEITLSDSVDELGSSAFKDCSLLVRINGTSNLSVIKDSTFEGCSALAYFPDLSNVTSIGNNAFKGCSSLTTFTISDSLTSIGNYAFENCVMLLQTPDLTNVTSIGDYAFKGCTLLSEIKSLDGCASFGEGIFTACENIAKITLSFRENIEQFYVSSFFEGSADSSKYYGVTGKNGSTYYIPKRLTEIEYDVSSKTPDYFLYGLASIIKVTDKSTSSTSIGKHAFDGCISLVDYNVLNNNITSIEEYSFYNCASLTSLVTFDIETVQKYAFANCSSLLVAPILENATYVGDYAFSGCALVSSIKAPNAVYMGLNSLYGCSSLSELEIPFIGTNINSSEAFGVIFGTISFANSYAATQLSKTYYIPNGLVTLSIGGNEIKEKTCANLTSLKSLTIRDSVTLIYARAFSGILNLEEYTAPFIGRSDIDKNISYDYQRFLGYPFGDESLGITKTTQGSSSFNIPSSLVKINVTRQVSFSDNSFVNCKYITEINIPEQTNRIGENCFSECSSLIKLNSGIDGEVNIPLGVKEIPNNAFKNCSLITKVSLSNEIEVIGEYAFYNCNSISQFNSDENYCLNIPDNCLIIKRESFANLSLIKKVFVPDAVELINIGVFEGMDNIEKLSLPFIGRAFDLSSVDDYQKTFGYIFNYNSTLGTTVQGNYNYRIPTTIKKVTIANCAAIPDYAFQNCDFIEEIQVNGDAISIGNYAFQNCSSLTKFNSEENGVFNLGSLETVGNYAFQNCILAEKVSAPKITSYGGYSFNGCISITSFNSAENLNIYTGDYCNYIGGYAFAGLSLIENITINDSCNEILWSAFNGTNSLNKITLPFVGRNANQANLSDYQKVFGYIFGYGNATSESISQGNRYFYIPLTLTKVIVTQQIEFADYAFQNCDFIEEIQVNGDAISIGNYAFQNCSSLTKFNSEENGVFNIPENILIIPNNAFENCIGIEKVFLSNSVTSINNSAFKGCIMIESFNSEVENELKVPDNCDFLGTYVFQGLVNIEKIIINDSITTISRGAFYQCGSVIDVTIPFLGYGSGTESEYAMVFGNIFERASGLPVQNYPGYYYGVPSTVEKVTITQQIEIPNYAFYNCSNLKEIVFFKDVTKIGNYAFANCTSLQKLTIGDKYSSVGNYAFSQCIALSTLNNESIEFVTLGNECESIGNYAFAGWALTETLVVNDLCKSIGQYAFNNMNSLTNITLPFIGYNHESTKNFAYVFGTIPNTLKNVFITVDSTIPSNAFSNIDTLSSIHLITNVESIGSNAFYKCTANVLYDIEPFYSAPWTGSISSGYHSGLGTEEQPFEIFTASEFAYFIQEVNAGTDYTNVYFVLNSDINLAGKTIDVISSTSTTSFKGTFDGKGHKIYNISLTAVDENNLGLFGYVDGTIKNIGFEISLNISSSKTNDVNAGLVVGRLNGTLENVYVSGTLNLTSSRTSYVGGLIGYNNGSIINSYSNVEVSAISTNLRSYAAGLVGYNDGTIAGSFAYGNVSAKGYAEPYSYASGLVAAEGTNSVVTSCFRYSGQTITKFGSASTSYNNVGTEASLEDIISYCKLNWNGSVWSYKKTLPSF